MIKVLTICLPVFNGEKTVDLAINSILNAKLTNYEIAISDNASTDQTQNICLKYQKKFPDLIYYYRNTTNTGFAENYKKCIEKAQGKYLFFIGDDDYLLPKALNTLKSLLDKSPLTSVVCSDIYSFTKNPKIITKKLVYFNNQKKYFQKGSDSLSNWLFNSVLGSIGGYLIRTNDAKKYYQLIPSNSYVPQNHLVAYTAVYKDIMHYPIFSFAQRLTENPSQMANKQYKSLDIVKEILQLINNVSKLNEKINQEKQNMVQEKMIKSYASALSSNLVSYRVFGSFSTVFNLIKLLIKINKSIILKPRFVFYVFISLLTPQFLLRRILLVYRKINV